MSARLYLVRHGQTPSNVAGALDTALPGAPLTDLGHEQARTAGEWLARNGARPAVVFSSEATRARLTAGHVAEALGVTARVVPGVVEVQAGEFEMRDDVDAVLAYNRVLRDWLELGAPESALPGGEDLPAVRGRAVPVVEELRREYLDDERDAVLVIHGTLMRLIAVFLGAVPSQWALVNRIPNCGLIVLEPGDAGWTCHRWGDLEGPFEP